MRRTPATQPVRQPGTIRRVASATATLAVVAMACAERAWAQLPVPSDTVPVQLIEWDVSSFGGDIVVGALAVDDKSSSRFSKVWFATRFGEVRVYPTDAWLELQEGLRIRQVVGPRHGRGGRHRRSAATAL